MHDETVKNSPNRRRILALVPAGIAALALPAVATRSALARPQEAAGERMAAAFPCSVDRAVTMGWLGNEGWELRYRHSDYTHPYPTQHVFQEHFWWYCAEWSNTTNYYINRFIEGGRGRGIEWIGTAGVYVCSPNTDSYHRIGRAFDLTVLGLNEGGYIDCNTFWRDGQPIWAQRYYLGVVANTRRHFGTVITAWHDRSLGGGVHENHVHFDNGEGVDRIRTWKRTDTTLVQAAFNLLCGGNLAIDGQWGAQTQNGYLWLRNSMGLHCIDPLNNVDHAKLFLERILAHAFLNVPAGSFNPPAC